jgi:hypothetical protein
MNLASYRKACFINNTNRKSDSNTLMKFRELHFAVYQVYLEIYHNEHENIQG